MVCTGVAGKRYGVGVWMEKGDVWGFGGKRVVCGGVEGKWWYVEVWREKGGM